jgi:hypothetical protein
MLEQLAELDVSAIADLVRIKQEELVLRERLAKMESRKGAVSPLVYQKVRQDYETRQGALDVESRPLKERARREYAKLQILRAEVERAMEDVRLQKEELEFRQELGEFRDEQFREKIAACEKQLAERTAQIEEIGKLRERFAAAFHSEQELETPAVAGGAAPMTAAPEGGAAVRPESPTRKIPRADQATMPPGSISQANPPASEAPASDAHGDRTVISTRSNSGGSQTTAEIPKPGGTPPVTTLVAALPSKPEPSPEATQLGGPSVLAATSAVRTAPEPESNPHATTRALVMPRILLFVDNQPKEEHPLKPGITSIGRSPKNVIKLQGSDVSRHHANIVLTPAGYRLIDRGAENGVFVNGKRVDEHLLADGDVIQIGTQKLLYKD